MRCPWLELSFLTAKTGVAGKLGRRNIPRLCRKSVKPSSLLPYDLAKPPPERAGSFHSVWRLTYR
jgi:hypothetical protein